LLFLRNEDITEYSVFKNITECNLSG